MNRLEPIIAPLRTRFPKVAALIEPRLGMLIKMATFGTVGVINTAVDYCFFLLADAYFSSSPGALRFFGSLFPQSELFSATNVRLAAANIVSWVVAVTGSFLLNSLFTFASITGRKLSWRAYRSFIASNVVGLICATTVLIVAANVFDLQPKFAKLCAIPVSFIVNFSLAHFVVFRPKPDA